MHCQLYIFLLCLTKNLFGFVNIDKWINRIEEMIFDEFYRQLSDYRHEIEAKREYAGENENYRARTNARPVQEKRK